MFDMFNTKPRKVLRAHQVIAIELVRQSLKNKNRRIVVQMPTGAGKTITAAKIIEGALLKGNRVIFTAPAISLIDQTVSAFEAEGITDIGVMQASHPRTNPLAQVQVASVQTLARREIPAASLVIVDECFVADTIITMSDGSGKPIRDIRLNDAVMTATGHGLVLAISEKDTNETYLVEFDDGKSIECTGNHPFFTSGGWVEASALEHGSSVVCVEGMPGMWQGVWPCSDKWSSNGRRGVDCTTDLLEVLLKEVEQPIVEGGSCGKGVADIAAYWAQAKNSWREWCGHDSAAGISAKSAGERVDGGACGQCVEGDKAAWCSRPLQAGYREHISDDCDRGGRREPLPESAPGAGSKEGCVLGWRRVVCASRVERQSHVAVFNLQVSGHPSYFAGGNLVHNCHIGSVAVDKLMDERPDVFFIGLSATPWAKGMGLRWQDLVVPCTIGDLIGAGFLSKFTAYAPTIPDLSGVKIQAGEYAEAALLDVMGDAQLIGGIVETWLAKGDNRPTLLFAVNCLHAQALQAEFQRAGVAAGYVDAHTDGIERKRLERQFRSGEVKVACSVRTLTTGIDWPVSCIIDAAPTKSEMLHVQKIGRGLRVNKGTEDLLILDHAGNSLRLGLVTDIHYETLDATAKGEKQERKAKAEKLPKECANCAGLHAGKTCPFCGHERKPTCSVEEADGELSLISGKVKNATREEKQDWWSSIIFIQRSRRKSLGWASHTYKEKFGVWPRGLADTAREPLPEVANFIRAKAIRFAKAQEAKRGAK